MKFALLFIFALSGCAHTTLYRDGQKIAAFQGDMDGVEYSMAADGTVKWKAVTVDHSAATLAQGEASRAKIQAAGATGITALLR